MATLLLAVAAPRRRRRSKSYEVSLWRLLGGRLAKKESHSQKTWPTTVYWLVVYSGDVPVRMSDADIGPPLVYSHSSGSACSETEAAAAAVEVSRVRVGGACDVDIMSNVLAPELDSNSRLGLGHELEL